MSMCTQLCMCAFVHTRLRVHVCARIPAHSGRQLKEMCPPSPELRPLEDRPYTTPGWCTPRSLLPGAGAGPSVPWVTGDEGEDNLIAPACSTSIMSPPETPPNAPPPPVQPDSPKHPPCPAKPEPSGQRPPGQAVFQGAGGFICSRAAGSRLSGLTLSLGVRGLSRSMAHS